MAETAKHGAVDAVHPDVQTPQVSMGAAGGPLRQLQGGQAAGHRHEEALRLRGGVLQAAARRRARGLRPRVPGHARGRGRGEQIKAK